MLRPVPRASLLKKGFPIVVAAGASLLLHGAVPWLGFGAVKRAPERVSLELLKTPPPLLAVADEEREGPADDPGPKELPAKEPTKKPAKEPAQKPARKPTRETRQRTKPAPEPAPSRRERVARRAEPVASKPEASVRRSPVRVRPSTSRLRPRAGLEGGKGNRTGGRKPVPRAEGGGGGNGGGSTTRIGRGAKGDPEAVYACTATGLGERIDVRSQRPITEWVTVVPTVLMPFDTRPGLGDYVPGIAQVVARRHKGSKRAGPVELALPAEVLQMELDAPRGVRVALGRLDGRCLVGFRYTRQLFPMTLHRVPMRVLDRGNRTADVLVDVTLFKDGSFELARKGGDPLPFTEGRLKNADAIKSTIENHYAAARALKEMAGWFGIDLKKVAKQDREKQARERTAKARRGKERDKERSKELAQRARKNSRSKR